MFLLKGHKAPVHSLSFSPDGTLLASAAGNARRVWLWNLAARKAQAVLGGHRERLTSVAVSPDGRLLASSDHGGTVKLWQLPAGRQVDISIPGMYRGSVGGLAFAPDGRTLAVSATRYVSAFPLHQESGIRRWTIPEGAELSSLPGQDDWFWPARSLAFSPDGRTLAAGWVYGAVALWDLATGTCQLLRRPGIEARRVRYSPDGRTLAIAWTSSIVLWDVATQQARASWQAHRLLVNGIAFTPDSRTLLTVSGDRLVKVWDTLTGQERAALSWNVGKLHSVAVAPDGMTAAAGGDADIVVWDLDGG
jgi:WD40 repeat protein